MQNSKINIIFIDDDRESANSIILHLRKDFNVELFLSARDGLQAVRKNGKMYDVLVIDYHLVKEKNGIEVLREIKRDIIYYIPAIMISAVVYSMEQVVEATNAGFAKYFGKHDPKLPQKLRLAILELAAQRNDVTYKLEEWMRELPRRENEIISEWDGKKYTVKDILSRLKNNTMDPDIRMRLTKYVIDFLISENMRDR